MLTGSIAGELRTEIHAPEMSKGFGTVVDGIDYTDGDVAQDGGDVHDDSSVGFCFEVGKEADGEVHGTADVDGDFLVRLSEVEVVVHVEGALHAGVVDEAIYIWKVVDDGLDEGGNGCDVPSVEDVIGCVLAHFCSGGTEGGLGTADDDDFFALGDEVFRHCTAEAPGTASDDSGVEI